MQEKSYGVWGFFAHAKKPIDIFSVWKLKVPIQCSAQLSCKYDLQTDGQSQCLLLNIADRESSVSQENLFFCPRNLDQLKVSLKILQCKMLNGPFFESSYFLGAEKNLLFQLSEFSPPNSLAANAPL